MMFNHEQGIIAGLNNAKEFLRHKAALDLTMALTIKQGMKSRHSFKSALSWIANLFLRDGSRLEFFSGVGVLGWAVLSDISTDKGVVSASMDGPIGLISPDNLVLIGYALGVLQLIALVSMYRWARVPVAFLMGCFIGILTLGVWNMPPVHPPGSAFYGMAWGMDVYIFLHLCRRTAV